MNAIQIIAGIFLIVVTIALIVWEKIVSWAQNRLFPWIERNLAPKVADLAKQAFAAIDKVAVAVRNAVKQAWENLRRVLLKVVVNLEKQSSNKWVKRWTAWMLKKLESGEIAPVRRIEEEEMKWDELPPDVRESSLRYGKNSYELDFTDLRDRELAEMLN